STTRCSRPASAPAMPSAPAVISPSASRAGATTSGSPAPRSAADPVTRRFVAWLLAALAIAGCAASDPTRPSATAPPPIHVTLLQINDAYVLEPVDGGRRGGMARLGTLVKRARAANPNTILAHAGDAISPSPMSTVLRGEQMIAVLNAVGVDVATFGNHEFDFGVDVLRRRMGESRFAWLTANVLDRATGAPFGGAARERLVALGSARIGVFGLT